MNERRIQEHKNWGHRDSKRAQKGIFGGGTISLDTAVKDQAARPLKEWLGFIERSHRPMEWEEFLCKMSVDDLLQSLHVMPLYQYLINYLIFRYNYDKIMPEAADIKFRKGLFAYIDHQYNGGSLPVKAQGDDDLLGDPKSWERLLDELVLLMKTAFAENDFGEGDEDAKGALTKEDLITDQQLKNMLTKEPNEKDKLIDIHKRDRIFRLALGLALPAEDVELLIQTALHRRGFNYYDRDEFLMYCVLKYEKHSPYRCYMALQRDYAKLPRQENEKEWTGQTVAVRRLVDDLFQDHTITEIYTDALSDQYRVLNPKMKQILMKHKAIHPRQRTAVDAFIRLYNRVSQLYQNEMNAYQGTIQSFVGHGRGFLDVFYDPSEKVEIPEGTLFYAQDKSAVSGKNYFRTLKDYIFEKSDDGFGEVDVCVQGVLAQEIMTDKKKTPGYQKKGVYLVPKAADPRIRTIETISTLKYVGHPGTRAYAQGQVRVCCLCGTKISKNTIFQVQDELKNIYEYEVTEDVIAKASKTIEIVSVHPQGEKADICAKTGTITGIEQDLRGVYSVSNPKPVHVFREDTSDAGGRDKRSEFRRYLYYQAPEDILYEHITPEYIGKWFYDTEIKDDRFSNIFNQKAKFSRKKNEIPEDEKGSQPVRRSDLLTMVFMIVCRDDFWDRRHQALKQARPYEEVLSYFVLQADKILNRCGMGDFYLGNPYEALLAFLIITDTPVDSLRNIWRVAKDGVKKNG